MVQTMHKLLIMHIKTTPADLPTNRYVVVAHDAGAANILMSNEAVKDFPAKYYVLSGPALIKWGHNVPNHKLLDIKVLDDLADVLRVIDIVLTGTGWSSDIEHNARILAKQEEKHCVALIDHWVNYIPRFTRQNKIVLPDEVWVTDEDAFSLANATFPTLPVFTIKNHYLLNAKSKVVNAKKHLNNQILYVLEPVHEDWGNAQSIDEEFQALNYFKQYLTTVFPSTYPQIRLRMHPSESEAKYRNWVEENRDLPIVFDTFEDIETSIANADWVFGCESYGLIVAIECGKTVYSTIPHWAPRARLPHDRLKHLRDLIP